MNEFNKGKRLIIHLFHCANRALYFSGQLPMPPSALESELKEFEQNFESRREVPTLYKIFENKCDYDIRSAKADIENMKNTQSDNKKTLATTKRIEAIFLDLENKCY